MEIILKLTISQISVLRVKNDNLFNKFAVALA